MKCRFKSTETGKTITCHTLNDSSLALPRIVAALPEVLVPYYGKSSIQ